MKKNTSKYYIFDYYGTNVSGKSGLRFPKKDRDTHTLFKKTRQQVFITDYKSPLFFFLLF